MPLKIGDRVIWRTPSDVAFHGEVDVVKTHGVFVSFPTRRRQSSRRWMKASELERVAMENADEDL